MVPGRKSIENIEPEPASTLGKRDRSVSKSYVAEQPANSHRTSHLILAAEPSQSADHAVPDSGSTPSPDGAEALRDLRSLWLAPSFLIALIAALFFLATRFPVLQIHWRPLLAGVLVAFVAIYIVVDRRSRSLSETLERHAREMSLAYDRLAALNAIGRTVAEDLNLERVLQAICDETEKALGADRVSVELAPRLRSAAGRPIGFGRRTGAVLTFWSSTGAPANASGQASSDNQVDEVPDMARLSMPIEGTNGEPLGSIRAFRAGMPFDPGDRELLTAIAGQVTTAISNAQNYEASRRRSSDLRDLILRGADAVAANDVARIAGLVARQACRIVSCEGAGIFLFGEDRRILCPAASVLADGRLVDGSRLESFYGRPIALGEATLLKAVLASPGPLPVEDVAAFNEGRLWSNQAGVGSMIAAPIVGRVHGALGVLIVHWPERRTRFDMEESGLVGALAAFAAVAIENAKLAAAARSTQRMLSEKNERLLEETQRRRAELQKLVHRVGDALVAGLSSEKVAQLVLDQARQMIPCHHAIFWVREDADLFLPVAVPCSPHEDLNFGVWNMKESGFLREAVENAHPIVVSDVAQDSRLAPLERTRLSRDDITSLLAAPLRGRGDRVIGLLALYWTLPRHTPSPEEFDTADVLATQAAAALENARLHTQLEEAERRLSTQLDHTTAARDFVERILQNVQAAVLVVGQGPDFSIQRANALAEAMPDPDRQHDGLVGRRLYDVFPGLELVVGAAMERALSQGEPVTLIDSEYKGFGRGHTYWTFSITPQRDPGSREITQVIVLALETTGRILLMRENERNAKRVETLVQISQRLNATLEPSTIYAIVAEGALGLLAEFDDPRCALYVREAGSGRNILTASAGNGLVMEPPAALVRQLYASQMPLISDDSLDDSSPVDRSSSSILLPLISQNAAIGYLVLTCKTVKAFEDARLVDGLVNLASLSAAVIRNALAFAYEQNIAETLQKSFLPSMPAQMPGLSIAERYFPTLRNEAEIGGDYYDVIVISPTKLAFFIGDISGKGLAAAVHTAMAKYTLRAFIAQEMSPLEVVTRANTAVARWTGNETFSTLFYGVIDVESGTVEYVNAGHEPPVLLRADGSAESLYPSGPSLGIFHDAEFETGTTALGSGDILTLYTDGLSDARNSDGVFFAEEGIRAHVASVRGRTVDEICDSLYAKAVDYTAGHRLRDDVAMLVIKIE